MKSKSIVALLCLAVIILAAVQLKHSKKSSKAPLTTQATDLTAVTAAVGTPIASASTSAFPDSPNEEKIDVPQMMAEAATDVNLKTKSIDDYKGDFRGRSNSSLETIVHQADAYIEEKGLVVRANQQTLSHADQETLARVINVKAAAQILLIDRLLASDDRSSR